MALSDSDVQKQVILHQKGTVIKFNFHLHDWLLTDQANDGLYRARSQRESGRN